MKGQGFRMVLTVTRLGMRIQKSIFHLESPSELLVLVRAMEDFARQDAIRGNNYAVKYSIHAERAALIDRLTERLAR